MEQLQLAPLAGYEPEIGRWLAALQEVRERYTLRHVKDLDPRLVDWEGPDGQENAIGSLLYHIAGVEMGWLWFDVKGLTELPPDVQERFPLPNAEPGTRRLSRVLGTPLAEHVERLHWSREVVLRELKGMSLDEWRRSRDEPLKAEYKLTPEWVVFHLVEHEAVHAGQISSLKARGSRMLASSVS